MAETSEMGEANLATAVESGDFAAFEAGCLELIEAGNVKLTQVASAFELLAKKGEGRRAETIGPMLLEAAGEQDKSERLAFAVALLNASPENPEFRRLVAELYRKVHGSRPGFDRLLDQSGLEKKRPARVALKILDLGLSLEPGAHLISRMDQVPAEVVHVDPASAMVTLRSSGRVASVGIGELASEYDKVSSDDFRVLRKLAPQKLSDMAANDPVSLVVAILHSHGEAMDLDELKHELVPGVVAAKNWSDWWSKTRALLKRSPNVVMEGRSPAFLRYTQTAVTAEDEGWAAFSAENDPVKWMAILEGYLREKKKHRESTDSAFLKRAALRITEQLGAARPRRPTEALAIGLVIRRLADQGIPFDEPARNATETILAQAGNPVQLVGQLAQPLWDEALDLLPKARPSDWTRVVSELIPIAPEGVIDDLVKTALKHGMAAQVQQHIDSALADPVSCPSILAWLWRGPEQREGLVVPNTRELLARILGTLSALGRTLTPSIERMKNFRAKMKSVLGARDYARFREALSQIEEGMAVTLRRQIERLEGLGDNVPREMLDLLRTAHPQLWARKRVEPWEDPSLIWTTQDGLNRKKAELDDLVNVKMRENSKAIGRAAEFGDLSENSEYKFALEERDLLRARLAKINDELSRAQVVHPAEVPTDRVGIGSAVTLVNVADGSTRHLTFFGPWEADVERGIYNYMAPVGQKLMGVRVGDRVTLTVDDQDRQFEVRQIVNGFEKLQSGEAEQAAASS